MTTPYAEVIGDPIIHSKSPLIHNFWLQKLGIDAEYRACHVRPEELADYFAQRRSDPLWRGCNVTIPHKVAALQMADVRDGSTDDVGAANCITPSASGLIASNTDTVGIAAAVRWNGSPTCLIGAGGAALAVAPALDAFVACFPLNVIARDPAKAAGLLQADKWDMRFFDFDHAEDALAGATGVINATPLGMAGQPAMPDTILENLAATAPTCCVFDMVYAPLETELLRRARHLGRETVDGLTMLIGQAAAAFEKFFGQPAPRQHDAELRALLTR